MNTHIVRRLALLLLALGLWGCGDNTPPRAVAIGDICQQDAGTKIVAEGYLALPVSALICREGQCKINFYDNAGSVSVEFVTSKQSSPGKLTMPPERYTLDDLQVTLADGSVVDRATKVRITGPVRKPSSGCYLDAHVTERP